MFRRLAPLLKLVAATFLILVLIDAAFFRSGVYARLIRPDSTAGSVVGAEMAIRYFRDPTRRNILVLGNSQIGEGFSAQIADAASGDPALHFVNGSAPGTTPRVWDYLLRKVDPKATRFRAIVMMVNYDETYNWNDLTDYSLDINYTMPLLRLGDIDDFPRTFTRAALRGRAARAILLPLQALHEDAQDLLAHPFERFHQIHKVRPIWLYALGPYGGQGGTLPSLDIDIAAGQPKSWGDDEVIWKPKLEGYFRNMRKEAPKALQVTNAAYESYWIERIAARYRTNGATVIVFSMVRGPWKAELMPPPMLDRALSELRDSGQIVALPEKPELFFDTLHLNSTGREKFSKAFATKIAPLVH